ncbi:MAG: hypothetical protein NTY14_07130 [Candidatus Omnitrophica bacterium]|nr:hypothetical protein [Candidatus Omnitrophota bacterium]
MENLEVKLLEQNWLHPWQLERAKVEERNSGRSLWVNLVKLGFLSEADIALFLAQESNIPYVRIADYVIDQSVLRLIEENFSLQYQIIPLFKLGNTLFVACSNPLDTSLLDTVAKMTGLAIEPLVSEAHAIMAALDLYWRLEDKNFELAKFIVKQNSVQGFVPWRGTERLFLEIPLQLKILDEAVVLLPRQAITGHTFNISSDANFIGAQANIFLPKGLIVLLSFEIKPEQSSSEKLIELRGEIVRSAMIKAREYLLGIKLLNASEAIKKKLLDLVLLK